MARRECVDVELGAATPGRCWGHWARGRDPRVVIGARDAGITRGGRERGDKFV